LRATQVDSSYREDEGDTTELLGFSEDDGVASSGGGKRWKRARVLAGARREEEKEREREGEALGLLRGGRGVLIADGGQRRESWRRRATRRLHAGASGRKVGDDSLESGWAKVGFAREERGRELGQIWHTTRKDSFFFQNIIF
jgi:hypothetical protein